MGGGQILALVFVLTCVSLAQGEARRNSKLAPDVNQDVADTTNRRGKCNDET